MSRRICPECDVPRGAKHLDFCASSALNNPGKVSRHHAPPGSVFFGGKLVATDAQEVDLSAQDPRSHLASMMALAMSLAPSMLARHRRRAFGARGA